MRWERVRGRGGMTLVELLVALVVMGLVTSAALAFVQQQERAFSAGSDRMDVLQNYRFAADLLERELRTVGSGVPEGQPVVVYADSAVLAFNVDYATNDTADVFAVYENASAPAAEVGALTRARRFRLPGTTFVYPDSSYRDGGGNSPAETIVFFFAPDTTTADRDDSALYRQVNDQPPAVVARNLARMPGLPFFQYQELLEVEGEAPRAAWVPAGALPLRHGVPVHLSAADSGSASRVDGVRAVRVSFASTNGETGALRQSRAMSRLIGMPNAGRRRVSACGEAPLFLSAVTAAQEPNETRVTVSWSPSLDEAAGEDDVVRYAIFRREPPSTAWGEPYFSVPAGLASYSYSDAAVAEGSTYEYGVTAQDCTPSMSSLRASAPVTIVVSP